MPESLASELSPLCLGSGPEIDRCEAWCIPSATVKDRLSVKLEPRLVSVSLFSIAEGCVTLALVIMASSLDSSVRMVSMLLMLFAELCILVIE